MADPFELNRRDLLRNILVLAGAAATTNFSLNALASVAAGSEKFLDASAMTTLAAVADTIVPVTDTPGALAADVPARFDALLLNWAAPATREMIVASLARIDSAAAAATGKAFASLSADERKTFLVEHDKAALQPAPPPENAPKKSLFSAQSWVADNGYQRIKGLIVSLYYISEIALTQELVYEHVPGKWVPSLKITPGMRPFAGTGPF
jgi:hypothetical protein